MPWLDNRHLLVLHLIVLSIVVYLSGLWCLIPAIPCLIDWRSVVLLSICDTFGVWIVRWSVVGNRFADFILTVVDLIGLHIRTALVVVIHVVTWCLRFLTVNWIGVRILIWLFVVWGWRWLRISFLHFGFRR